MKKTILITGSNRGIGYETARQLASLGHDVIISARDKEKLSGALKRLNDEGLTASGVVIDVANSQSIRLAANDLSEKNTTLDVLINNAGILLREDITISSQNSEILKKIIDTNCFGVLEVTLCFLPLMNNPGKIINISSEGGSMSLPVAGWNPAYCVSKSMLNALTRHLAYELREKNIAVNAVSPGWVQTSMGGNSAPRTLDKGAETPVWLATEVAKQVTGKFFKDRKEIPW